MISDYRIAILASNAIPRGRVSHGLRPCVELRVVQPRASVQHSNDDGFIPRVSHASIRPVLRHRDLYALFLDDRIVRAESQSSSFLHDD